MSVQTAPTGNSAGNVIRWIVFVPAAIFVSIATQFLVTLLSRVLFGPRDEASVLQTLCFGWVILLGGSMFVWIGAMVAPSTQRKTALTLFWVYTVLFTLIELLRTPTGYEPLPHLARLGLGILGAIAGLSQSQFQIKGRAHQASAKETGGR